MSRAGGAGASVPGRKIKPSGSNSGLSTGVRQSQGRSWHVFRNKGKIRAREIDGQLAVVENWSGNLGPRRGRNPAPGGDNFSRWAEIDQFFQKDRGGSLVEVPDRLFQLLGC